MNNDDAQRPPRLDKKAYEAKLRRPQTELVEMQQWVVKTGARIVIVMEGRDAADKGSAIRHVMQYLNPRACRIEALPVPTSHEQGQWYFQRYVEELPTTSEIVISDRSRYNRVGVERVVGFCTSQEYRHFLHQVPIFEHLPVEDGIILRRYWFSVSDEEQVTHLESRHEDPLRRWELSPMDLESITCWEDYSRAKDEMLIHIDIPSTPWYMIESEDKKRSRIDVINHLLTMIPYERIQREVPEIPERLGSKGIYERLPHAEFRYVPDVVTKLGTGRLRGKGKSGKRGKKHRKDKKSKKK